MNYLYLDILGILVFWYFCIFYIFLFCRICVISGFFNFQDFWDFQDFCGFGVFRDFWIFSIFDIFGNFWFFRILIQKFYYFFGNILDRAREFSVWKTTEAKSSHLDVKKTQWGLARSLPALLCEWLAFSSSREMPSHWRQVQGPCRVEYRDAEKIPTHSVCPA